MTDQPAGPRQVAQNEAAKQAVGLAFTVVAIGIMIWAQRHGGIGNAMQAEHDRVDPSGASLRRMTEAQRSADKWDRVAAYCFRTDMVRLANWAHQRAEAARAAYERERP